MSRLISLPMTDWPAADRIMWDTLFTAGDPFGDDGALSHLRATSQAGMIKCYGRWLEWLFQAHPSAVNEPPPLRATPERVASWITSLDHVKAPTRMTLVNGALQVLREAAPKANWDRQCQMVKRLMRDSRRAKSDRKTGRILSSVVLFDAGLRLAGPMAEAANTPLNAALMRRDGTVMALLSLLHIRLRALSELKLCQSVLVSPSRIIISLTGDMTKNGLPWESTVPDLLMPLLRRYMLEVRPWLMQRFDQHHQMLWVGRMGEPLSYGRMKNLMNEASFKTTGIRVSTHLFRDATATTLTRLSPDNALLIRPLLAHSSYAIAERHYLHAQGIEAGRDYAAVVARLTKGEF